MKKTVAIQGKAQPHNSGSLNAPAGQKLLPRPLAFCLLMFGLAMSLLAGGCVSTSSPTSPQPLHTETIEAAIAIGKTKKEVKAALGPPHDRYKNEQWIYVYQDRDSNTYRLDILFGYQDRIILYRFTPCQYKKARNSSELKCL